MKKLLTLLFFATFLLVSTSTFSFTFYVNPGNSIQDTIDIAIDGDIIIVRDGTYTGDGNRDIDFHGKAITLKSENGPEVTIIDCEGTDENNHRGFYFNSGEGADSIVDGFTITNGYVSGDWPDDSGGGIFCCNESSPTISDCILNGNSAYYGAAIYCDESDAVITNCTISGNDGGAGGGIYCESFSNLTIINCAIDENSSWNGGGIYCIFDSSPIFINSTISSNSAGEDGGGIYSIFDSSPIFINSTISSNSAGEDGGGIYCHIHSSPTIVNCTISANSARYGGGIFFYTFSSSAVITNSTISGNSAQYGGGIMCIASKMAITNSTICGNTAIVGGGIHCCYSGDPTLANCIISGNLAEFGGGISSQESDPVIASCTISDNEASKYGGGLFCYAFGSPTTINCILWGNTSTNGHEIALMNYDNDPSALTIRYSDVEGGVREAYVDPGCTLDMDGTNINEDPLFVKGPLHDYYLGQVVSGQSVDSPCVDAGSDTAENLGLDELSTRTDGMPDTGIVDMGYHAPYALWIDSIVRTSEGTMLHWNALPGISYLMEFSTDLENWTCIPAHETDTWIDTSAGGYSNRYYRVREQ